MLLDFVYNERICVSVGLDLPLQRKNTTRFQSAELRRIFESTEAVAGG